MTRTGKIARLPNSVREELNRRLLDGVKGRSLVPWLNALPEVQAILQAEFQGRPILEQNLSEWKQGGFLQWTAQRSLVEHAMELKRSAEEISAIGPMAGHLAALLTPRIAVALQEWTARPCRWAERHLRMLLTVASELSAIRRGDHSAEMLAVQRERVSYERIKCEQSAARAFEEYLKRPEVENRLRRNDFPTELDWKRLIELMFGKRPEKSPAANSLSGWDDWAGDGI